MTTNKELNTLLKECRRLERILEIITCEESYLVMEAKLHELENKIRQIHGIEIN